jgi:Xaa-Pro dipeptidase
LLTREGCEKRQKRLLAELERANVDAFITADNRAIYYFTGAYTPDGTPGIFACWTDGTSLLVSPANKDAVATSVRELQTYSIERSITHPWRDAARLFSDAAAPIRRAAVDVAATPLIVVDTFSPAAIVDATDLLLRLRRTKEGDEIAEIRQSLELCAVAFNTARNIVEPGITEVDVFNALHAAINRHAGTNVAFPGDFACGVRGIKEGGLPTGRKVQAGDLYILDLFPAPAFYFGDTCRTFAVGRPSQIQLRAWDLVCEAIQLAENAIRPGVPSRDVYRLVKDFLDGQSTTSGSFWHHVGHGIGFRGHEAPRIIPGTEDRFQAGDVITIEPGIYLEELQGGIRIEDNYIVTEDGLENLFAGISREL